MPSPLVSRPYAGGHYVLTVDGCTENSGPAYLKECGGGMASASLVQSPTGSDMLKAKHISTVEMKPLEIKLGAAACKGFLKWIDDWWARKATARNGMIVHANSDLRAELEHEFYGAELLELGIPAMDANGKDAVYFTIKMHPQSAEMTVVNDGYQIENLNTKMQKQWAACNYRMTIHGFEDACKHISKIDALTVKSKMKPIPTGRGRFPELIRGGVEFPNVSVYLPLKYAQPFLDWHKEFHLQGKKDPSMEKNGSLTFLAHDLTTELFTINFNHMSILNFEIEKAEANAKTVKRAKIEMFVESWKLDYSGKGFSNA
jgi:hypothetical protein